MRDMETCQNEVLKKSMRTNLLQVRCLHALLEQFDASFGPQRPQPPLLVKSCPYYLGLYMQSVLII